MDEKEEEEEAEVGGGRAAAFYHQLRCCLPPFSSRRHQKKSGGSSVLSTLLLRTFLRGLLRTRRRRRPCQKGKRGFLFCSPLGAKCCAHTLLCCGRFQRGGRPGEERENRKLAAQHRNKSPSSPLLSLFFLLHCESPAPFRCPLCTILSPFRSRFAAATSPICQIHWVGLDSQPSSSS